MIRISIESARGARARGGRKLAADGDDAASMEKTVAAALRGAVSHRLGRRLTR